MADAGCDDRMIMAVTGQTTAQMVSLYTRRANQKKRALRAVTKWEKAGGRS
jgi:hypothetical protein